MRAYVGRLWSPRPELTLVVDGRMLDLAGPNPRTLTATEGESST